MKNTIIAMLLTIVIAFLFTYSILGFLHILPSTPIAQEAVEFNDEWCELVPAKTINDWLERNRYSHVEIISLTACPDRPAYWVVFRVHSMEEDLRDGIKMTRDLFPAR